jgi:hypothetical protein
MTQTRQDLPIRDGVVHAIRARTPAQITSTQIVRPRPHRTRGGQVEKARGTGALSQAGGACSPAGQRWRSMISSAVADTIACVIQPSRWGRRRRGGWIGGRGFGEELMGSASTWVRRRR